MNMILQAIKALFRKTDKQIDEVSKRVEETKKNIPKKLSALENDLFYNKVEPVLTLTKDDFVPMYFTDYEGNPTEIDFFYYKGTPKLDWFTDADALGFVITGTEDGDTFVRNHNIPNAESGWNDDEWIFTENLGDGMLFCACDECSVAVSSGFEWLNTDNLVPEDAFYVQTYWHNGESVGFDSITIYKVNTKKIPSTVLDVDFASIEAQIGELWDEVNYANAQLNGVSALADEINGEVI